MDEVTPLEKVASNSFVKATANAIAVSCGTITPLAAFVPFLVDTLASRRQGERIEKSFKELNVIVAQHADKLSELTDDQYKVVSEAISAAFYTINEEKLDLLKYAAANAFLDKDISFKLSDPLSRLIRDISAAEAAFVIKNFQYETVLIREPTDEEVQGCISIRPNSDDEIILSGLIHLGLVYTKVARYGFPAFQWSPLVVKLIRLMKKPA